MAGLCQVWEVLPKSPGAPRPTRLALLRPQSVARVVFHDRRLQYTEQQQLDGWRWSRPGDRILDIGEWGGAWTLGGHSVAWKPFWLGRAEPCSLLATLCLQTCRCLWG